MPEVQSMSFDSPDRSGSGSGSDTTSASCGGPPRPHAAGDRCLDAVRRLGRDLSISDLRFVQRLGSGDIGSVYLAEFKAAGEGCVVAAKVMDKKELEGRNKEARAKTEREILRVLDHPFLPRLYGAAENDRLSCLLTEFCPGGDLHILRQRQPGKRFHELAVRFYAAEVVVALEYIHMMGIIYRDLKPENVLVRADGHIMLTDFDLSLKCDRDCTPASLVSYHHHPILTTAAAATTASCILPRCILPAVSCFHSKPPRSNRRTSSSLAFVAEPVDLRSMSFVGTHEYLAPEIVAGEGHGSAVDWWTLGVFVYELLYGVTPFRGGGNEETLGNIVARGLEFPREPAVSAAARDLVAGLLVKAPEKRMGSAVGAAAVKRHPFFAGVNWALLRCTAPPYVPPAYGAGGFSSREMSDESCPGTPVEYY